VVTADPGYQGLPLIVTEGIEQTGISTSIEKVVVSAEVEILQRGEIT
jgi:hypothetical protein